MKKINIQSLSIKQVLTLISMWQNSKIAGENRNFREMVDRCYMSTPWQVWFLPIVLPKLLKVLYQLSWFRLE